MIEWLNSVNTTTTRILASILMAFLYCTSIMWAILLNNWLPTDMQMKAVYAIGFVVLTMMGFDVIQFASKRFSDAGYAAAKNPTQPVSVDTPPPAPAAAAAADGAPAVAAPSDSPVVPVPSTKLAGES